MVCIALSAGASGTQGSGVWAMENARLERQGNLMQATMDFDLSRLKVASEEAMLLTPYIVNGADSLELPSVGIYGRNRYYHYLRKSPGMLSQRTDETVIRSKNMPLSQPYTAMTTYQDWMDGAKLIVKWRVYGCCFTVLNQGQELGSAYTQPEEAPLVAVEEASVTRWINILEDTLITGSLDGSARVEFIVDRTELRPDWSNNKAELAKITQSIDTVLQDSCVQITEVWLKGFASPESPYAHNADLARGRVEAVKAYIESLYQFPEGMVTTEYEPEDWDGLRLWVEASNLPHKEAILKIIDTPMDNLDRKEWLIKSQYPSEYQTIRKEAYPPLRHTEYKIKYRVTRVERIEKTVISNQ